MICTVSRKKTMIAKEIIHRFFQTGKAPLGEMVAKLLEQYVAIY